MNSEYIIHGVERLVQVSTQTLGEQLFQKLKEYENLPTAMVDISEKRNISYKTIFNNSVKLAINLQVNGFNEQDVIGICSRNCEDFLYPLIAGLYLGIPITTFSPSYTSGEMSHVANISKPTIMFCNKENLSIILEVNKKVSSIKKIIILGIKDDYKQKFDRAVSLRDFNEECSEKAINLFKPHFFNIDDREAFIIYSSGTTGLPKGVVLTHKNYNFTLSVLSDSRFLEQIEPGNGAVLGLLPLFHAYGLVITILNLIRGRKIILLDKFDPIVFLQSIQDYKITELTLVPTLVRFLATSPLINKFDLSSLEEAICASAPLSIDMEQLLKKRLSIQLVRQAYGMTELSMIATVPFVKGTQKFGSCGVIIPDLKGKVVDTETGKSLGPMQQGELWFKGDAIMKGYAGDEKATRDTIDKDGWLHTGDIGYYDEDKSFFIVDRLKELIKYKAFQVPPAEIEALLITHPAIQDAGVIGIPNNRAGELPMAFVVKKPNANVSEEDVTSFVASQLSQQKWLRGGVKFVAEIPRNPTGKILRRALRNSLTNLKSHL